MAILESVPGIQVTILSQGKTLDEYHDDGGFDDKSYKTAAERISTSYIECVTDEEFQIKVEMTPDFIPASHYTHLHFTVYSDGKGLLCMRRSINKRNWSFVLTEAIKRVSRTQQLRQRLKFSPLRKVDATDSTRMGLDTEIAANLGNITVCVHGVKETTFCEASYSDTNQYRAVGEISEKALKGKAISHIVSLGVARVVEKTPPLEMEYPDGRHSPLAIFRFKYRSREALQQELIIPRSPSPDNSISLFHIHSSSGPNEANNRVAAMERLAQLKREIEQIKSEVKGEEGLLNKGKRSDDSSETQTSGRVYKTSRHDSGMLVVDLTDD